MVTANLIATLCNLLGDNLFDFCVLEGTPPKIYKIAIIMVNIKHAASMKTDLTTCSKSV